MAIDRCLAHGITYDGTCPLCELPVRLLRLQERIEELSREIEQLRAELLPRLS